MTTMIDSTFHDNTLPQETTDLPKALHDYLSNIFQSDNEIPKQIQFNTDDKKHLVQLFNTKDETDSQRLTSLKLTKNLSHKHLLLPRLIKLNLGNNAKSDRSHESYWAAITEVPSKGNFYDLLVKEPRRFADEIIRTLMIQLIKLVSYLHEKSIAHLDIKPENVYFDDDFNILLAGFDMCLDMKVQRQKTEEPEERGTIDFRAHELRDIAMVEDFKKCDVFSVAILMFMMKSGGILAFKEQEDLMEDIDLAYELGIELNEDPVYFWQAHEEIQDYGKGYWCGEFKELFQNMCNKDASKRASMPDVMYSKWISGKILSREELKKVMSELISL